MMSLTETLQCIHKCIYFRMMYLLTISQYGLAKGHGCSTRKWFPFKNFLLAAFYVRSARHEPSVRTARHLGTKCSDSLATQHQLTSCLTPSILILYSHDVDSFERWSLRTL